MEEEVDVEEEEVVGSVRDWVIMAGVRERVMACTPWKVPARTR